MKTKHLIEINQLLEFKDSNEVIYASSSSENKKFTISLHGGYRVYVNNELKFESTQPYPAIEFYNEI